jgi:hypothetical protein
VREPNGQAYRGPTWRDVYGALDLIEERFGGGFVLQMTSAATYGTHRARGLHLRAVWRRWYDFQVVEWRATNAIYSPTEHASVPALAMTLIRDLWDKLQLEGFEKHPSVPPAEVEGPQGNCADLH